MSNKQKTSLKRSPESPSLKKEFFIDIKYHKSESESEDRRKKKKCFI